MPVSSHGRATPGGAAGGYSGGTGNWGSGSVSSRGGGGGGNQSGHSNGRQSAASFANLTKKNTNKKPIKPIFKQQTFNVKCTGMKPNTVHKFYYEGVERGQDCIPVYPKPTSTNVTLGSPLKTDSEGKIEFSFYFTLEVEQQVDASNKVKYELAGDKKFELRATDSSAFKIVPFKKFT